MTKALQKVSFYHFIVALIALGTLGRIALCFWHNPMDYIFSDSSRHWMNGKRFLHPDLMGKCDPVIYQGFVYLLQKFTGENRFLIALVHGILSALMPWTFYRAAREMRLPKIHALKIWALIAWTPSLAVIFHYFMIEVLLLPLEGLSLWTTARYLRKGDGTSFLCCVFCWSIASLTKPLAGILALTSILYAWWSRSRRIRLLAEGCAVILLLFIPVSIRSYQYLGFVAPTGSHWTPEILHKSDAKHISIQSGRGHWGFSSPSCYVEPLSPLTPWMIHRAYGDSIVSINVNLTNGDKDWKAAYNAIHRDWEVWFRQWLENILLFLFAPSWPDSNHHDWDGFINYWTRWEWAPLIFILFELNVSEFKNRRFDLIPILVAIATIALISQNMIDMEGRYRKPLEPLFLFNLLWVLYRSKPFPDTN